MVGHIVTLTVPFGFSRAVEQVSVYISVACNTDLPLAFTCETLQIERSENRTQLSNCFEGAHQHTARESNRWETTTVCNARVMW
jgi:hypothetical protein